MTPDYQREIHDAVEAKLRVLDSIPFGKESGRRFEVAQRNKDGSLLTPEQHREMRRLAMIDIAERLGLHFFEMTDAVLLDQLIAVSAVQNHDTAGLLRSLINSFLIAYTKPETTVLAYQSLQGLEVLRAYIEKGMPPVDGMSRAKH